MSSAVEGMRTCVLYCITVYLYYIHYTILYRSLSLVTMKKSIPMPHPLRLRPLQLPIVPGAEAEAETKVEEEAETAAPTV